MQNQPPFLNFEQSIGLEFLAKQVVEGFITGLHKSPFHGFSVEFAEHRLYNAGDNIRNVDWKLYARTDKLFTKRYEEETNLRCQFVLDVSSSMYFPEEKRNKLIFASQSTAVLIELLARQRDAFGLSLFADDLQLNTPVKSTQVHRKYIISKLEELLQKPSLNIRTEMPVALHQVAELVHKRSLVIIFSDMLQNIASNQQLDELFASLQHLKFNKHEIILFNVIDKIKEVDFEYGNSPHTFIDMETGEQLKIQPNQVKDLYVQKMQEYRHKLKLRCAQYQIDLVDADINAGYIPILESYLIKRQKMY